MPKMRAKMEVVNVEEMGFQTEGKPFEKTSERLNFRAVAMNGYPADGSDEDNTYAKFSPDANCNITVANPLLFGQFKIGEKYYIDFIKAVQ